MNEILDTDRIQYPVVQPTRASKLMFQTTRLINSTNINRFAIE
jgi:hypothetical protein